MGIVGPRKIGSINPPQIRRTGGALKNSNLRFPNYRDPGLKIDVPGFKFDPSDNYWKSDLYAKSKDFQCPPMILGGSGDFMNPHEFIWMPLKNGTNVYLMDDHGRALYGVDHAFRLGVLDTGSGTLLRFDDHYDASPERVFMANLQRMGLGTLETILRIHKNFPEERSGLLMKSPDVFSYLEKMSALFKGIKPSFYRYVTFLAPYFANKIDVREIDGKNKGKIGSEFLVYNNSPWIPQELETDDLFEYLNDKHLCDEMGIRPDVHLTRDLLSSEPIKELLAERGQVAVDVCMDVIGEKASIGDFMETDRDQASRANHDIIKVNPSFVNSIILPVIEALRGRIPVITIAASSGKKIGADSWEDQNNPFSFAYTFENTGIYGVRELARAISEMK